LILLKCIPFCFASSFWWTLTLILGIIQAMHVTFLEHYTLISLSKIVIFWDLIFINRFARSPLLSHLFILFNE
jgi:hypothetical protein